MHLVKQEHYIQLLQDLSDKIDGMVTSLEDDWVPREKLAASLSSRQPHFSTVMLKIIRDCIADQFVQENT